LNIRSQDRQKASSSGEAVATLEYSDNQKHCRAFRIQLSSSTSPNIFPTGEQQFGRRNMIEIKDMSFVEMESLLDRVGYGHLGCAEDNHPYVVPIHFAYDDHNIYLFTTEGKKSEMIDANREVCLQVEEVIDSENWSSVIVVGDAEKLTDQKDREKALSAIIATNPNLTPALSFQWVDKWVRQQHDVEVIYRIDRKSITGRRSGGH
jgi:uncharacterized protein